MRYQPIVISLAAGALLIAGCSAAGTDEKNYKVNDDPTPTNQDSIPGRGSMASPRPVVQVATVDEPPISSTATDATVAPADAGVSVTAMPQHVTNLPSSTGTLPPDTQPSVTGLDRSQWPRLTVGPESGTVGHYPAYFADPKPEFDRHREAQPTTEEERLTSPLRDSKGESWVGRNKWSEFFIQPANVIVNLVESPYLVYKDPPWKDVTTPANPSFATVVPNKPPRTDAEIDAVMLAPNTGPQIYPTQSAKPPVATPDYVDPDSIDSLRLATDPDQSGTSSATRKQHVSKFMTWLTGEHGTTPEPKPRLYEAPATQPSEAKKAAAKKQHVSPVMKWLVGE